ncbi:MAG: RHS repeat-associated core domain-containing protein [Flavobacterium sp.]
MAGSLIPAGSQGTTGAPERKRIEDDINGINWAESYTESPVTIDDFNINYTIATAPKNLLLLTLNYYDQYGYSGAPGTLPVEVDHQDVLAMPKALPTGSWARVLENPSVIRGQFSHVFYDMKGRPIRNTNQNYLGGFTNTDTTLDFIGKTLFTVTTHKRESTSEETEVTETYEYTPQDRLERHNHQISEGGSPMENLGINTYDNLGQLVAKQIGNGSHSPLQIVNYKYNIRGWLKQINDIDSLTVGTDPEDLFAFKINYNDSIANDIGGMVKRLYNGNIAETSWKTKTDNIQRRYGYSYDNLNRLLNSVYQKPDAATPVTNMYNESMTYDKNGNILSLQRNGDYDADIDEIQIDNLYYEYDANKKNQLNKVTDYSNHPKGFNDAGTANTGYTYDANGNMVSDPNKGIEIIEYNHLNLPTGIRFPGDKKITYLYDATGKKVRKRVSYGNGDIMATDYLDGFQYVEGLLIFFPHAEGYVNVTNCRECETHMLYNYVYQYKDHLGNVRLSYGLDKENDEVKVLEENHYYPFGLKHTNYNYVNRHYAPSEEKPGITRIENLPPGSQQLYKYKFLDQERQDELGLNWDSFRHRNYDYSIGRFMGIDPVSEEYMSISTYQFAHNNPVWKIEIEGLEGTPSNDKTDVINEEPSDSSTAEVIKGVVVGIFDNIFGTNARDNVDTQNPKAFNDGLNVADGASLAAGTIITYKGLADMGAGGTTMAGAATVTAASGGLSIEISGPAFAAGAIVFGTGAVQTIFGSWLGKNATKNMSSQSNKSKGRSASDEKLIRQAEEQKAKEQKAQERAGNKTKQTQRGNSRTGNSNQDVKGSHASGKKAGDKHSKANARRARDQGVRGPDTTQ